MTYCFESSLVKCSTQSCICICEEWKRITSLIPVSHVRVYRYLMSEYSTHESMLEGSKDKGRTQHHLMDRPNSKSRGVIVGGSKVRACYLTFGRHAGLYE